ncbi:MAG: hypothetical protein IJG54_07085 [Bacteroidales bacterium]|nr:hypothetical protein [Bacteroidales bacterium]MBQ1881864.1 hypothetical protein [Bacteroidales bacterium]MBQ3383074.1 hypothetical protein [Bacteroidales bacterium]
MKRRISRRATVIQFITDITDMRRTELRKGFGHTGFYGYLVLGGYR